MIKRLLLLALFLPSIACCASRKPVVVGPDGNLQQIQAGDTLDPATKVTATGATNPTSLSDLAARNWSLLDAAPGACSGGSDSGAITNAVADSGSQWSFPAGRTCVGLGTLNVANQSVLGAPGGLIEAPAGGTPNVLTFAATNLTFRAPRSFQVNGNAANVTSSNGLYLNGAGAAGADIEGGTYTNFLGNEVYSTLTTIADAPGQTITGFGILGGQITFNGTNAFTVGENINVVGLTNAYANGSYVVTVAGGSGWKAAISHPDASASDSGTASITTLSIAGITSGGAIAIGNPVLCGGSASGSALTAAHITSGSGNTWTVDTPETLVTPTTCRYSGAPGLHGTGIQAHGVPNLTIRGVGVDHAQGMNVDIDSTGASGVTPGLRYQDNDLDGTAVHDGVFGAASNLQFKAANQSASETNYLLDAMITGDRFYVPYSPAGIANNNTQPSSQINGLLGGVLANLINDGGYNGHSYSFLDGTVAVGLQSINYTKYGFEFANEFNFVAAGLNCKSYLATPDPGQVCLLLDNGFNTNVTLAAWASIDAQAGCLNANSPGSPYTDFTIGTARCHIVDGGIGSNAGINTTSLLYFDFDGFDMDALGAVHTPATGFFLKDTYYGRIAGNFHDLGAAIKLKINGAETLDYLDIDANFGPNVTTPLTASFAMTGATGAFGHHITLAGSGTTGSGGNGVATNCWYDDWAFGAAICVGNGSPVGSVAGGPGMLYRDIQTGTLWLKTSGPQVCPGVSPAPPLCTPPTSTAGWVSVLTGAPPGANAVAATKNPIPITSLSYFMVGLGNLWALTPASTGTVFISTSGNFTNTTTGDTCNAQLAYGTGAAPANNTPFPGGAVGGVASAAKNTGQATLTWMLSGLTVGTPYWFDVAEEAVTGGSCTWGPAASVVAYEVK